MSARSVAPLLLLAMLAGCLGSGNAIRNDEHSCADIYCIQPLDSKPARLLEEKYHLKGWTLTPPVDIAFGPSAAEDAAFWGAARQQGANYVGDVLGFDFQTGKILPIEVGVSAQSTNQWVHDNEVAFHQRVLGDETFETVNVWNRSTGKIEQFRWPSHGIPTTRGYDDNWILVSVFQGGSDSGQYAFNIHDERLLKLHQAMPTAAHPNGTAELVMDLGLAGGYAYIAILWNRGVDDFDFSDLDTTIYRYDLANGGNRSMFHRQWLGQINDMDIGSKYVVWNVVADPGETTTVWAKDWRTGELFGPWSGPGKYDIHTRTEGDWVVYESQRPDTAIVAVHVPSNTSHVLIPAEAEIMPGNPDTDGKQVYFLASRNDEDLFGKTFEDGRFIIDHYVVQLPVVR